MRLIRRSLAVIPSFAVVAALAGCGDDDPGSNGESSSEGSTSTGADTTTTESSSTAPADTSSSEGSESSTGVVPVTISGVVQDLAIGAPIPDAAIALLDVPGFENVSAADGTYAIGPLTPGDEIFVTVDPSEDYLGTVIPLTVPDSDDDGQVLAQISQATYDMQIMILQPDEKTDPMPDPIVEDTSIVIVRLLQNLATGATIDVQPEPSAGSFYAPNADGVPVLGQNVVEFSLLPVVIYFNVTPAEAGALTITATHPDRECTVVHPSFPTLADHVTLVDVDCPSG